MSVVGLKLVREHYLTFTQRKKSLFFYKLYYQLNDESSIFSVRPSSLIITSLKIIQITLTYRQLSQFHAEIKKQTF